MLKNFIRRHWAVLAILTLVSINYWLFLAGRDFININHENTKHLKTAIKMTHFLRNGHPLLAWEEGSYPPLSYMPALLLMACSNICTDTVGMLSQLPFILLTGLGAYGIVRQMRCSNAAALSAAFITSNALVMRVQQNGYLNEYALVATVTVTYYFLLRSDFLARKWSSLLCAVSLSASILCKFSGPFFALPGFAVVLFLIIRDKERRWLRLKHSLFFIVCMTIAWFSWYTYPCIAFGHLSLNAAHTHHFTGQYNSFSSNDPDFNGSLLKSDCSLWQFSKTVAKLVDTDYILFCFDNPWWIFLGIVGLAAACWLCWREADKRYAILTILLAGIVSISAFPIIHPIDRIRFGAPSQVFVLLFIIISAELWSKTRYLCLAVINWFALLLACYWFMPHISESKLLNAFNVKYTRPVISLAWHDPLGIVGPPSEQELLDLADLVKDYEQRGYQPVLINTLDFGDPLAALYIYSRNEQTDLLRYTHGALYPFEKNAYVDKSVSLAWDDEQPYLFILQDGAGLFNADYSMSDLEESHADPSLLAMIHRLTSELPQSDRELKARFRLPRLELRYYLTTAPLYKKLPLNSKTQQQRMKNLDPRQMRLLELDKMYSKPPDT